MARRITAEGEALIKKYEGYRNTAYRCPAGRWTIGYGLTGPDIRQGTVWTDERCESEFQRRLRQTEADVERLLLGARVSDGCFSAIVSLTWNIGIDAFAKSTLLRKLRAGDPAGAWSELPRWVHSNGQLLPGLIKRRAAEQDLWDHWRRTAV
jgi:lysozyme